MIDIHQVAAAHKPILLVVDPKPLLPSLRSFFSKYFEISHCDSVVKALQFLGSTTPDIVCVSTRFTTSKIVLLLEAIKEHSASRLIPLIFNLDLNEPTIVLPGTRWAGKLGLATSDMSDVELEAMCGRLLKVLPN